MAVPLLDTFSQIENTLLQSSRTSTIVGCGFEWWHIPICHNTVSNSGRPPVPRSTLQFCRWIGVGAPHSIWFLPASVQSSLDWRTETWTEACWIQSSYLSEQWERYASFEVLTAASSIAEDSSLLEYDAVSLGEQFLMIWGIVVSSDYGELLAQQHSGMCMSQKTWIFSGKGVYHMRRLEMSVSCCLSQSVQYVNSESSVIVWVNGYLWKRFDTKVWIEPLHRSDSFVTFVFINVLIVFGRMKCELLADVLVAASWNILGTYWHKLRKVVELFVCMRRIFV